MYVKILTNKFKNNQTADISIIYKTQKKKIVLKNKQTEFRIIEQFVISNKSLGDKTFIFFLLFSILSKKKKNVLRNH